MLQDFLKHQEDSNELFLNFHSFFNIESGLFAIGTYAIGDCDECDWSSLTNNTTDCSSCARTPKDYLVGIAGDGDGVYTVWEIWDASYRTIGIMAVLDSGYKTATAVRELVESGTAPFWDDEYVSDFNKLKRMVVGTLEDTSILMIGETALADDSSNAIVSVLTGVDDEDDFEVSYFVEEPGKQSGPYPSETTYKPRVILALRDEYSHLAGAEEIDGNDVDWKEQEILSMSNLVASHLEPMGIAAAFGNFLNRELELKEYVENGSPESIIEQAKRFAGVWALFIEYHFGDTEASEKLKSLGYKFKTSDYPQMRALAGITDENFEFGSNKGGSGLTKTAKPAETSGAKFCSECGEKRPGESKFCPSCGTAF
jgi:hypothetical protein